MKNIEVKIQDSSKEIRKFILKNFQSLVKVLHHSNNCIELPNILIGPLHGPFVPHHLAPWILTTEVWNGQVLPLPNVETAFGVHGKDAGGKVLLPPLVLCNVGHIADILLCQLGKDQ